MDCARRRGGLSDKIGGEIAIDVVRHSREIAWWVHGEETTRRSGFMMVLNK